MTSAIIYCYLFLSCWKLILGQCFEIRLLFRNIFGGGGGGRSSNIHQHPRVRPPPLPASRSAPRFLSAQRHPTVPFINVASQSHNFPNSECRKTVEICRLTPFCPNPPKQLPNLQFHLQAWTLGVSRFMLGLFGSNCRNSYPYYKPCISIHALLTIPHTAIHLFWSLRKYQYHGQIFVIWLYSKLQTTLK